MSGAKVGGTAQPCPAEEEKKGWIEFEVVDEDGKPIRGEHYRLELPDESIVEGIVGDDGKIRLEGIEPGQCKISFPDLDAKTWELG